MKSGARKIGLGFLIVLLLLIVFTVWQHWLGKSRLTKYKQQMAAQGERFDYKVIAHPASPENSQRSAEFTLLASRVLGNPSVYMRDLIDLDYVTPGKVLPLWNRAQGTNNPVSPMLEKELVKIQTPLTELRKFLTHPPLNFGVGDVDLFTYPRSDFVRRRNAFYSLAVACGDHLVKGQRAAAFDDLTAALALLRYHENEWMLINQMIRIAFIDSGFALTWQALAAPGWTEPQLAQLQTAWEGAEFHTNFLRAIEMERAHGVFYFAWSRKVSGKQHSQQIGAWHTASATSVAGVINQFVLFPFWQIAWTDQDELFYLQTMQNLLDALRKGEQTRSWTAINPKLTAEMERLDDALSDIDKSRYLLTSLLVPNISRAAERFYIVMTERALAITAIALHRYRLAEGHWPEKLEELVPRYLSAIPMDEMIGEPLRYQRGTNDTFTLYSVGKDGRDDGGNPNPPPDRQKLRGLWDGLDVVWPSAAN